DINVI
ncbi:hypothetical protein D030_5196B, partial [Vibrio parahaemolyticus AQ3810]